ncbi:hypothetical protein HLH33_09975 [Gluconacetobacter diazotrophicus]|uniref:Uncharacterized protein n=1 Tax=Gluconacetobacter diazotrophicus TaxID=33996 RepID=A0A7W4I536_GLUDI|nr:hypothetical protein [Gluconacetobacter diazotrophicus]
MTAAGSPPAPDESNREIGIELQLTQKLQGLTDRLASMEQRVTQAEKETDERLSSGLGRIEGHLDALEHRQDQTEIALQKTGPAVGAPGAGASAPARATAKPAPVNPPAENTSAPTPQKPPHPAVVVHLRHYTVQAGAPDLAYLTDDQGNALRVEPGDELDGWGKVSSVSQSGASWVVHTEHGTIR